MSPGGSVAIASSASVPTKEAQRIVNELTNICTVVDASPFRHFRGRPLLRRQLGCTPVLTRGTPGSAPVGAAATVNGYLAAARGKLQARLTEYDTLAGPCCLVAAPVARSQHARHCALQRQRTPGN